MNIPSFLDPRLPLRFWDKVSPCPMSGCWLWTGHVGKQYRPGVGSDPGTPAQRREGMTA
jgi:hypothetical protein